MTAQQHTLEGQVALVTGGGRGLGRAFARALSAEGAAVAVVARSGPEVEETARELTAAGGRALALVGDVVERAQMEEVVARVEKELGPIDLLINNAGVSGPPGAFWEADPDDFWRVVEVNLRGASLCSRLVLAGMVARGRGRIINIGSDVATRPTHRNIGYAVSKAALLRLTDCLAQAVRPHGVSVFALSPGMVHTRMTEHTWQSGQWPPEAWAEPEVAARAVVLLASGRGDGLTGRYVHAVRDDLEALITRAEQIEQDDLYALRLRS